MRDFTRLTLTEVSTELDAIAAEAAGAFGSLNVEQLNWRPDPTRWSVAQCFEHLLTANRMMMAAADRALDPTQPRTLWQRIPLLPGLWGRLMIRSQSPQVRVKYTAPPDARPASSDLPADILTRFLGQTREAAGRVRALDEASAGVVIVSPFVRVITYTVLDGWRLVVAHDWRHVEQARRVTQAPGFPSREA